MTKNFIYWAVGYFLTVLSCLLLAACFYRIRRGDPYEKQDQVGD